MVSTDPPYYDNISYADLSDFFYVWMRRNLKDVYPDIFSTMLSPKETELIASVYRHGSKETSHRHFETGMTQTFSNLREQITEEYPLTIYYAYKHQSSGGRNSGWAAMLTGIIDSGFVIEQTWPLHTEMRSRLRERDSKSLSYSIILVCRLRAKDAPTCSRRDFLTTLREELRKIDVDQVTQQDLSQICIGMSVSIYSKYSSVLNADNTQLSVGEMLSLVNEECSVLTT